MHNENYYRSKIPVKLVLLFLANLVLILLLEILLFYRYPAQLTEETLASFDSAYDGCTIVSSDAINRLHIYLVRTDSGEVHLIPSRTHGVFFGRSRIYKDKITPIPADTEKTSINLKLGIHTAAIEVTRQETTAGSLWYGVIHHYQDTSVRTLSTYYMAIAALLELLELFVITKMKGNE